MKVLRNLGACYKILTMKGKKEVITSHEFAEHFGVAYTTAATWLQRGIVPGAQLVDAPRGAVWEIPTSALSEFKPPRMGRPKGAKAKARAEKNGATIPAKPKKARSRKAKGKGEK